MLMALCSTRVPLLFGLLQKFRDSGLYLSWPFQDKWCITDHSSCCSAQYLHLPIQMPLCLPHFRINQGSSIVLCTLKSVLVLVCVYGLWFGVSSFDVSFFISNFILRILCNLVEVEVNSQAQGL